MIIATADLHRVFGRFDALRGLSIAVPENAVYALVGANGAGKTTTIKLLMNILEPSQGSAQVLGVDSRALSHREFAQIGYVSENQKLPDRLTAGQFLDYLRPFYPTWDRDLERSILARLRLPMERRIHDLSHGMRMKLALACALPFRPKLLVLDEPFSGLDPLIRDEFMELLAGELGRMTVFISSHELSEIESITTHVCFIDQGRMLFQESMADLGARSREITLTLEQAASIPPAALVPEGWLHLRATGNVLRFVHTRYSEQGLATQIATLFQGVKHVEAQSMALRSIFTALARAAQDGAHA